MAYDCQGISMKERMKIFRERGLEPVQEGCWMGGGRFAFWWCEGARTWVETIEIEEDFDWPEPEEWFPAPPAAAPVAPVEKTMSGKGETETLEGLQVVEKRL